MDVVAKLAELKCISFSIEFQPQASNYETVEDYLTRSEVEEVTPEDREEMIRRDVIWSLQWYPHTPIGFCAVAAATLERCIELALAGQ